MAFSFSEPLDQDFLDSLYGDDISYAQEVFTEFLKNTKEEYETIKTAYKDNDLKKIRQNLHKIKPTFAFVGLSPLTEKLEKLIVACDTSTNVSQIEPMCSELFKEIEGSFMLVEKELDRMKTHVG
jgi:hypothetical protein